MGNMITDWETISANTIKSLEIMGGGILAIFIVILIIMACVYILNAVDKRMADKKTNAGKVAVETSSAPAIETSVPSAPSQAPTPVPSVAPVEKEERTLEELTEPKYRKTGDPYPDSKYRKMGNDD